MTKNGNNSKLLTKNGIDKYSSSNITFNFTGTLKLPLNRF